MENKYHAVHLCLGQCVQNVLASVLTFKTTIYYELLDKKRGLERKTAGPLYLRIQALWIPVCTGVPESAGPVDVDLSDAVKKSSLTSRKFSEPCRGCVHLLASE